MSSPDSQKLRDRAPLIVAFLLYSFVLFYLFVKRVPHPDVSYDTLNYQYFSGYLAWTTLLGATPESTFLPLGLVSGNPAVSLINFLLSIVLGYRLGTILSLISIMLAGFFTLLIVARFARITWSNVIFVLPLLFVNEGLFQISTYFTDNFFAAVSLAACLVLIRLSELETQKEGLLWISFGLLLGLQLWKLTNVFLIIPEVLVAATIIGKRWLQGRKTSARYFLVFTAPIASVFGLSYPFWMWVQSGNPVFPFYNTIFGSKYWSDSSWIFFYGPQNPLEAFFYPIVSSLQPTMLGEVKDIFPDLRLNFLFFLAVVLLIILRLKKLHLSQGQLVLVTIAFSGYYIWAYLFGYSRYAIGLELLFGALVATLLLRLSACVLEGVSGSKLFRIFSIFSVSIVALIIIGFNNKLDISFRQGWGTASVPSALLSDSPLLNELERLPAAVATRLESADIVLQCSTSSSGLVATQKSLFGKPFVNIEAGQSFSMTTNPDYIAEVEHRLRQEFGTRKISFVSVYLGSNLYNGQSDVFTKSCQNAFEVQSKLGRGIQTEKLVRHTGFLGDKRIHIVYEFGTYDLSEPGLDNLVPKELGYGER